MLELRPYQQEAIDSVLEYWGEGGGNPLVDMATGLGKSVVIARLTYDLLSRYPDMRVLMLVHNRELVEQNCTALIRMWPSAPAGIYSAGLGRKDTHKPIIFGSIQSLFRKDGYTIGHRDLIIIDEAQFVPSTGDGMYRTLLENFKRTRADLRVCGFTATPYRLQSGRLDQGEGRLFDEVIYSYGVGQGIDDKWLSPLISKASLTTLETSGVTRSKGDFTPGSLEAAIDREDITASAVDEMVTLGADRRSWLVFCAGVKHAHNVRDEIRRRGVSCQTITGETDSGLRRFYISEFKAGRLRCLTNANVLTTGFDAPGVDMIAMLRPTLSTGLYVQMCGRGTRLSAGKDNCLVLDFAGNVKRHGPVDMAAADAGKSKRRSDDGEAPVRTCPECRTYVMIAVRVCQECGYEFPAPEGVKHDPTADAYTPILSKESLKPDELPVLDWGCQRHIKPGSPDSLKVTYRAGLLTYPEWVCFEHTGYARSRAEKWWRDHGGLAPVPGTIDEAEERWAELNKPDRILTRLSGGFYEIVGRRFKRLEEERAA